MGQRKLWEDMSPLEKLAAIRELAEQLKALRDDRSPRQEAEPIQLRPSACSRLGNAFLLSTAIPLDHSTARFHLSRHPAWNVSPATERDGASYFGDEKPRQQKLAGLIEDVTDRKKRVMRHNQPLHESSRMLPRSPVTPAFMDIEAAAISARPDQLSVAGPAPYR